MNAFRQSVTVQDGTGAVKYRQDSNYDQYSSFTGANCITGAPQHDDTGHGCSFTARGNLTSVTTYTNPSAPSGGITKSFTYDSLGNLRTAQLNCCQLKTWNYSATNKYAYPDSVVSGSSSPTLTTSLTYDLNMGLPLTSAAPNGVVTTLTYDNLGRPLTAQVGSGNPTTNYTYSDYDNSSSFTPWAVKVCAPVQASNKICQESTLDSMGRTATQETLDGGTTVYSATDTQYDSLGRTYKTSNPYTSSDSNWTTTSFDALGRVTSVALQDNSQTTYSYSDATVTVTDPANKPRKMQSDALGRLVSVWEPDPANGNSLTLQITYSYSVLDELTGISQGSQTRTYVYDALGRLTSTTTPETGLLCFGTKTGSSCNSDGYDSFDNLLYRTDARGVVTSYGYDTLNRLAQKSYNDGSTPTVKYGYDAVAPSGCTLPTLTINNGIGKRTGMCDAAGSEAWSYDISANVGWKTTDARTINGITKTFTFQSNLDGSLKSINYAGGETVTYTPGGAGRPVSAVGAFTYATNVRYTPSGSVCNIQGNWNGSKITISTFNNRGQPATIHSIQYFSGTPPTPCAVNPGYTGGNIISMLNLAYNFVDGGGHNNGNVISITNNLDTTHSQNFAYDSLNRLSTAQTTSTYVTSPSNCWAETYTYDPWGNLYDFGANTTIQSAYIGCSQESGLHTSATTKNQLASYGYDAAGNLISIPGVATFTYNAENQLVSTAGVNYTYDGDGRRVMKSSGTIYWYGAGSDSLLETNLSGAFLYHFVFFNGQRLARRMPNNEVHFFFSDHLGTARVFYCYPNPGVSDFYPFGGERAITPNCSNNYKFTGKERDSESGLDNFDLRYFGSSFGRFMRPDPDNAGARLGNPQSWNAYSYVLNNPLSFIDPFGLDCVYAAGASGNPNSHGDGSATIVHGDCINAGGKDDGGVFVDNNENHPVQQSDITLSEDRSVGVVAYTPAGGVGTAYSCIGNCPSDTVQVNAAPPGTPTMSAAPLPGTLQPPIFQPQPTTFLQRLAIVAGCSAGLDPELMGPMNLPEAPSSPPNDSTRESEGQKRAQVVGPDGRPLKYRNGRSVAPNPQGSRNAEAAAAAAGGVAAAANASQCIGNAARQ